MGAGGGLISSFPKTPDTIPWQFGAGWALLVVGIVFAVATRPVVWLVFYKYIAKGSKES
jgi:hypothetical protein